MESKSSRTGESTIWCYIREYDNTLTLNTDQKIKPELWDKIIQRTNIRKTKDTILKGSLKNINQYLNAFENKIYDITRSIRSKDFSAGFSVVVSEIKKQFDKRETDLFAIYDEFIAIKKLEVSKQSIIKFKRIKALLEEYQKLYREKLNFDKITPLFFTKFYNFLIERKKMLNNTASKNIQFLKTFLI